MTSAVGVAVGLGELGLALLAAVTTVIVLTLVASNERKNDSKSDEKL